MPFIRLLKHRRQDLRVDTHDLSHQLRAPAASAAGMVSPSIVVFVVIIVRRRCGTGPVRQLHHHVVYTQVDIVDVDRGPGPGGDGRQTDFREPER